MSLFWTDRESHKQRQQEIPDTNKLAIENDMKHSIPEDVKNKSRDEADLIHPPIQKLLYAKEA